MSLALNEGKQLIKLARSAIKDEKIELKGFSDKQGVFVTLLSYPDHQLRGCIGFPQPVMPLKEAVIGAAKSAAYSDSRFSPLGHDEQFTVELSVLSVPELIKAKSQKDILESFKLGKHGLIVDYKGNYGLLLPQVFTEWKATPLEAMQMTCEKAGLGLDAWKSKDCKIYKFEAQIFIEKTPNGVVAEKRES